MVQDSFHESYILVKQNLCLHLNLSSEDLWFFLFDLIIRFYYPLSIFLIIDDSYREPMLY